jgi:hypothetical protein
MRKVLLLLALLLMPAMPALAAPVCAVIFEVDLGDGGAVRSLKVARVTQLGERKPPETIPDAFLAAARAHFAKLYKGKKAGHFFTYLYFDPEQPTNVEVDVTEPPQRGGAEGP